MTREGIVAWAGGRFILLDYRWNQSYGEDGAALLGSGRWSAGYIRDCDVSHLTQGDKTSRRPWWRWR